MSWFDNLVGAFWVLLQILLWLIVIVAVAAVLVAIVQGIWQHLKRSKRHASLEWMVNLAEAYAISTFRYDKNSEDEVRAFTDGAEYAWKHLHGKK